MPPKKSDVWKYFLKLNTNSVKCLLCSKTLKSNQNTSNMRQHLRIKHSNLKDVESEEFEHPLPLGPGSSASSCTYEQEDLGLDTQQSATSTEPNTKRSALPEPGSSKEIVMRGNVQAEQPTLIKMLSNISSNKAGGAKYIKTTQAIVEMIVLDQLPFSFVEGEGFRNLMKQLSPLYKVPCRNTIKSHIDTIYEAEHSKFIKFLEDIPYMTITSDIWTDSQMASMLGLTVHGLREDKLFSGTVGVLKLNESHTSKYLSEKLLEILTNNNINQEKIVVCITDNGPNIVKAVCDLLGKDKHAPCFAHTLNLVCDNSLGIPEVKEIISKCRNIIAWTRRHVNASDDLKKAQLNAGVPEGKILKPILDVKTRWNSTFYMLERLIKLIPYLGQVVLNNVDAPPMISSREKEEVNEIISLLRPLEAITVNISGEAYGTMSRIIPLVRCGTEQLMKVSPIYNASILLKEKLLFEFDRRFGQVEKSYFLAASTLLDPRFKNLHFKDPVALANTLKKLRSEMDNNPDFHTTATEGASSSGSSVEDFDIWEHHKTLVHKKRKRIHISALTSQAKVPEDELTLYLSSPVTELKDSPLLTWNEMKTAYPRLYSLSRKYCHLIGTSVPSERLFSEAGHVANEKRSRLITSRLSKLLFLKSWLKNK